MAFKKVGDEIPVEKIYCSCGGEIIGGVCNKCSKGFEDNSKSKLTTSTETAPTK